MIRLENATGEATVCPVGAELTSFRVGDDELIWPSRPEVWSGSAPILFPIIGRLKGGGYTHGGQRFALAKHGLVRSRTLEVTAQSDDAVTFELRDDAATRATYPFAFTFRVTFGLRDAALQVAYEVVNDGDEELYFSLGSHPAIRLPLEACSLEDCFVELDQPETLGRYRIRDGLLTTEPEPFLDNAQEIPLTAHLFDDDALIFRGVRSGAVRVRSRATPRTVRVDTGGAPDLGLWAKPGADYVCVEPWWGHDDPADVTGELRDKPGVRALAPDRTFHTAIAIALETPATELVNKPL